MGAPHPGVLGDGFGLLAAKHEVHDERRGPRDQEGNGPLH